MLRFFRHIRKSLMEHPSKGRKRNKIRTYTLYAIGEIFLVVIGILIALQVNNWNVEQQALTQLENNFQNLIEDIESNRSQLTRLIQLRKESLAGAGYLMDMYEDQRQISETEFIAKLYPLLREHYFEINRSGIDKVMSSDAFEREEVENIRDHIKTYLREAGTLFTFEAKENAAIEEMEMVTAGNGYFRTVWRSFRKNRYLTTTDYTNPEFDFLSQMENDELLYIIFRYEFVSQFALSGYQELIEQGDEILRVLEEYKNSR